MRIECRAWPNKCSILECTYNRIPQLEMSLAAEDPITFPLAGSIRIRGGICPELEPNGYPFHVIRSAATPFWRTSITPSLISPLFSTEGHLREQIQGSERLCASLAAAAPQEQHQTLVDASHATLPMARPDAVADVVTDLLDRQRKVVHHD